MADTLLFLHLLSAAALVTAVVAFSAVALGARLDLPAVRLFLTLFHIGLVGVFLFGIALAIDIDGYHPWDGWILIALALWMAAGYTGDKAALAYREAGGEGAVLTADARRMQWMTLALVVL